MTSNPIVYLLNGPNANLYGLDPKGAYGRDSFQSLESRCHEVAVELGFDLKFLQSNHEGQIVDWIQEARGEAVAVAINATALTYTSISILDALLAFEGPVIEMHMGNIWKREPFRHHSYVSRAATGVIAGLGILSYEMALRTIARLTGQAS
jgi:3-dehydroquinate dehydratase II